MSQTDKERVIAERGAALCRKISKCASLPESVQVAAILGAVLDELRPIYDAGAKAGYRAAKEDAAKFMTDRGCSSWAAAIRKLEPKP